MMSDEEELENIRFSLIVPMYNAESYIERCLQSIKEQTVHNFEVWLVDDGSSDRTVSLCRRSIEGDCRFKIIENQLNHGVSAARNQGLKKAAGEWIWFIDADDWIEPTALECLTGVLAAENDVVAFDYVKERKGYEILIENQVDDEVIGNNEFCIKIFDRSCHFQLIWSSIFKREFLTENGIYFDESLILREDCEYIVRIGRHLRRCAFLKKPLYHYIVNMESASQKWMVRAGMMNIRAATVIYQDILALDNQTVTDRSYHLMQDVIKVAALKDIFHPDSPLNRRERMARLDNLLEEEYAKEALKRRYEGNIAKRILWFGIVHRWYPFLCMVSWAYYKIKSDWFWKLYSKVYKP